MRRLSLELRGHLPSYDELQQVIKAGKVEDTVIAKMVQSQGFVTVMRQYHTDLLWTNISTRRLTGVAWRLRGNGNSEPYHISSQAMRRKFRGDLVACLNVPAKIDGNGKIQCSKTTKKGTKTICQEGYVMVKPYWSDKEVKVCAFDGQKTEMVKLPGAKNAVSCLTARNRTNKCACGENLKWCMTNTTMKDITVSLQEQMLRYMDTIIDKDRPYTDTILGKDIEVNGPISHWTRYQSTLGGNLTFALPTQNFKMPILPFQKKTEWQKSTRGALHSGILTMAGYLLKFESNRSRANRFYNAFLCKHFQAPAGGLPAADSECHNEPNLTKRCGCKYCHQTVEPAAAYWGRWAEAGLAPLNPGQTLNSKTATFPEFWKTCTTPQGARSLFCRRFYFTHANHPDEKPYVGMLLPYVFATKDTKDNIANGPRAIAKSAVDSGTFAECTVKKLWQWFVGTPMLLPQQSALLKKLAEQFKKDKYSVKKLVTHIVKTEEYKLGRLLNR